MRDIKFRAWDDESKCWVNQNTVCPEWSDTKYFNVACVTGKSSEILELRTQKNFVWEQSTGLKDKHGVPIFEGDVVRFYEDLFEVKWDENKYVLFDPFAMDDGSSLPPKLNSNVEVIGNVHENKELLTNI